MIKLLISAEGNRKSVPLQILKNEVFFSFLFFRFCFLFLFLFTSSVKFHFILKLINELIHLLMNSFIHLSINRIC